MSEAVTLSEIPGVVELKSLGWSHAVPVLKQIKQAMGHPKLNDILLILIFGNAYFQAAITKMYPWTMHNL